MDNRLRRRLFQAGSFVLAGGLLYLALRGVDFDRVGQDLLAADYRWLIPLAVVALFSHWLRAVRWCLFIDTLPDDGRRVPVTGAFGALLIGYMVNYAAPRLGEVVRTANVATRYDRPFTSILGTVTVERLLDVLVLAVALLTLPLVFADRMDGLSQLLAPARLWLEELPLGLLAVAGVIVAAVGVFILWRLARMDASASDSRIARIVASFRDGLFALLRTRRRTMLIVTTAGIWASYALMAYIPLLLFGFQSIYGVTLLDSWGIMLLGALGIVVPSPGGVGSYHYITIQTLVLLFAFAPEAAASYAILSHAGQLILYVAAGFVTILIQGTRLRDLTAEAEASE